MFTLTVPALLALFGVLSYIIDHWKLKQGQLLRSEPLMRLACDESPPKVRLP